MKVCNYKVDVKKRKTNKYHSFTVAKPAAQAVVQKNHIIATTLSFTTRAQIFLQL